MHILIGSDAELAAKPLRMLTVHAHPDDEASKGASTLAQYGASGVGTVLVTATGGEEGEIVNKAMDRPDVRERLVDVRREELIRASEVIGFDQVWMLGYRDSGMPDSEANAHAQCFAQAPLLEAAGRLVSIIRSVRPHVIITYPDVQRGYRHPDHLRVHEVTDLAFQLAGDPDWSPTPGSGVTPVEPWQPLRLFYNVWSKARLVALHGQYTALGLESPYDDKWLSRPGQDQRITTRIDIRSHYGVRRDALLAHRTQVDPNERFWFGLPEDAECRAYPYEDYILAQDRTEGEVPTDDLFAGILTDHVGSAPDELVS